MLNKSVSLMREHVIQYIDEHQHTYMSVVQDTHTLSDNIKDDPNMSAEVRLSAAGQSLDSLDRVLTSLDIVFIVYLSLVFIIGNIFIYFEVSIE